ANAGEHVADGGIVIVVDGANGLPADGDLNEAVVDPLDTSRQHRLDADRARDDKVRRPSEYVEHRARLRDTAADDDDELVADRNRVSAIVRHNHNRGAKAAENRAE